MTRKDKEHIVTAQIKDLNTDLLDQQTASLFENFDGWQLQKEDNEIKLFTKKNIFGGITSVRYESIVAQSIDKLEAFAYDEMLAGMPKWSKEFISGEVLETINPSEQILRTKFKTPFFMKNREYLFYFSKIRTESQVKVFYRSIDHPAYQKVSKGFIRAKLYPTIYQFTIIDEHRTKVEHVLSTDLGEDMPLWFQNNGQVINGMIKANYRDCKSIRKVVEAL